MDVTLFCAGNTPAVKYARQHLTRAGVTVLEEPGWQTTDVLLDVPSFRPGTDLKSLDTLLSSLPREATLWGGNLDHPSLDGYIKKDLLKEESYLLENAAITADCALDIAASSLAAPWHKTPALILGWGRIGKCLAERLTKKGCPVTVAARSDWDRKKLATQDIPAVDIVEFRTILPECAVVFNTIPAMVMPEENGALCPHALKIDLASKPGIAGSDVVWARGLPGKCAPERSGKLIAQTLLRLKKEEKT